MPRFVLLRHECPEDYRSGPHWDLMFEREGSTDEYRLATWSLQQLPQAWSTALGLEPVARSLNPTSATLLADHRAAYLEYEGPISGDRGSVARCAGGEFRWLEEQTALVRIEILPPNPLCSQLELAAQPEPDSWLLKLL